MLKVIYLPFLDTTNVKSYLFTIFRYFLDTTTNVKSYLFTIFRYY